jgi:molecular chaperone HscB
MKKGNVVVENPSMFDPFEILALEKQFSLDVKVLEKSYFDAQKRTHPDRFIGASPEVRNQVLQQSSEVNQAYVILKSPLSRGAYLLKNAGIEPLSHDPLFLGQVMDWNERMDRGENLKEELTREEEQLLKNLKDGFDVHDYETARRALYRLTYIQKILKKCGDDGLSSTS